MNGDDLEYFPDRRRTRSPDPRVKHGRGLEGDSFKCLHCGYFVPAMAFFSGVGNRNHCPICLWSRHLDEFTAGDRLAFCRGSMQPVGLTTKRTAKKYASCSGGELMLIHRCVDCGRLSINRIAADDDAESLLAVLRESPRLLTGLHARLAAEGIMPLTLAEQHLVTGQLFGLTV